MSNDGNLDIAAACVRNVTSPYADLTGILDRAD